MQTELDQFFRLVDESDYEARFVTSSAFTQARDKLKHTAFIELNETLIEQVYKELPTKTWKGHRLLAVDGTTLILPDEDVLAAHFGVQPSAGKPKVIARLSACVDVLNGMNIDVQVAPYASSERDLAVSHLAKTTEQDLLLYDRGYPAFWFMGLHNKHNRSFCMRVPASYSVVTRNFLASNKEDDIVFFDPVSTSKEGCKEHDITYETLTLRAIRVVLSTGEIEVLVTNLLDKEKYPANEFKDLYARRWGVETDFDFKKNVIAMGNFSGVSVNAIQQDIFAKVFTQNIVMASVIAAQVVLDDKTTHRKIRYKVNVSHAISKMKHLLVRFSVRYDFMLFEKYIAILSKTAEAIRPNRKFKRHKKMRGSNCAFQNMKPAA